MNARQKMGAYDIVTGGVYLVFVDESDVGRDGLFVVGLRLDFADLVQVQLREIEFLVALGDFNIQIDQPL